MTSRVRRFAAAMAAPFSLGLMPGAEAMIATAERRAAEVPPPPTFARMAEEVDASADRAQRTHDLFAEHGHLSGMLSPLVEEIATLRYAAAALRELGASTS